MSPPCFASRVPRRPCSVGPADHPYPGQRGPDIEGWDPDAPLSQVRSVCVSCVRGVGRFSWRHRELLAPGTLFTLGSLMLLILAAALSPSGLVCRGGNYQTRIPFYLAAALVGSVYIWWSAVQGIRKGDFTADIPVSIATAAALIVHQYSAVVVVAVPLLLGGMLEELVAAGRALEALAKLLPGEVTVQRDGRGWSTRSYPDHWAPLAVVGRTQRWSLTRVTRISGLAAGGHVVASLVLAGVVARSAYASRRRSTHWKVRWLAPCSYGQVSASCGGTDGSRKSPPLPQPPRR